MFPPYFAVKDRSGLASHNRVHSPPSILRMIYLEELGLEALVSIPAAAVLTNLHSLAACDTS